jgi:hypothetical protein
MEVNQIWFGYYFGQNDAKACSIPAQEVGGWIVDALNPSLGKLSKSI